MAVTSKWPTVETILMSDGRLIDFSGKRRMQKSSYVSMDGSVCVRLDFRNGQTRTLTLRSDMMEMYAAHGAERKLGDEIVGVTDIADAVLAIDTLISLLDNGQWTKERNVAAPRVAARSRD